MTANTSITNSIAELNYILGKLVPASPPTFPGGQTLSTPSGLVGPFRMANFTQTDNTNSGNKSVAAGTTVSVARTASYTTGSITNVGPGNSGNVIAYINGAPAGSVALTGSSNGTYSNLVIFNNQDYHNVVSTVTAGFWSSFSTYMTGTVHPGWNEVNIRDSAVSANTSVPYWYYDNNTVTGPVFSNTAISLTTNTVIYSSTIPHFTNAAQFTLTGNVAKLSGDTFPSSNTFITGTSATGWQTPSSVTYSSATGITYPLARNLYVSSGSAHFSTTVNISTGFSSTTSYPSLVADNSYATTSAGFNPNVTILYKTGTSSNMEETSVTIGSTIGTGSGAAVRIVNPGSTDTPAYTGTESAFNSQTGPLYPYDATIVAGVLKNDQTNYSTGYLPVGPDFSSGRNNNQYFTFKFSRSSVSKFNIAWTGTIAGLWVALPGSGIDTSSTLNGWLDLSIPYAGSGQPGAGSGGNGSNGASLGGNAPLNTSVNASVTATFGTASSSTTSSHEIYVRIKLTAGQTVSALSLQTASN